MSATALWPVVGALLLLAWRERRGTPTTPASLSPGFELPARYCTGISACCCGGFQGFLGMRRRQFGRAFGLDALPRCGGLISVGARELRGWEAAMRWRGQWQNIGKWVSCLVVRVSVWWATAQGLRRCNGCWAQSASQLAEVCPVWQRGYNCGGAGVCRCLDSKPAFCTATVSCGNLESRLLGG